MTEKNGDFTSERMGFNDLIKVSVEELAFKTQSHTAMWGLGRERSWSFDQQTGLLKWSFSDRTIVAPAQITGSFNEQQETWLWSWANSSVSKDAAAFAQKARAFGEENQFDLLVQPKFDCLLEECWELAAITMHLSRQQGVYRMKEGLVHVFLCFGRVRVGTVEIDQ